MDVFAAMAIAADHGQLGIVCLRARMARLAFQIFVGAIQLEFRPGIVIKTPEGPAVGVVTGTAFRSQAPFVCILIRVAGRTGEGRSLELARYVTILAGRDSMLSY